MGWQSGEVNGRNEFERRPDEFERRSDEFERRSDEFERRSDFLDSASDVLDWNCGGSDNDATALLAC